MAKDGFGSIITIGLVGGAAYLAWQWWNAQQLQAVASAATAQPVVPPPPPGVYTPPTIAAQLQAEAASNSIIQGQGGEADAYQWSTLWNSAGQTAIPNVNGVFFPNGLPASAAAVTEAGGKPSSQGLPLMTLDTFLAGLKASGISGLGQAARTIPVPVVLSGKRHTMNLPAGTTPAALQAMLRTRNA